MTQKSKLWTLQWSHSLVRVITEQVIEVTVWLRCDCGTCEHVWHHADWLVYLNDLLKLKGLHSLPGWNFQSSLVIVSLDFKFKVVLETVKEKIN